MKDAGMSVADTQDLAAFCAKNHLPAKGCSRWRKAFGFYFMVQQNRLHSFVQRFLPRLRQW